MSGKFRVGDAFAQEAVREMLKHIGEDPSREGLVDTPARVVESYRTMFSGYGQDPAKLFTTFGTDGYDEMVVLRDIEFYSTCEHHMLPFFGTACIAYVPDGRVVGISKLARLLEVFSRRLQIQERLTDQITESMDRFLRPKGSACVLKAKHFCMMCRGVQKQSSEMVTSSLTGTFKHDAIARSEFLKVIED